MTESGIKVTKLLKKFFEMFKNVYKNASLAILFVLNQCFLRYLCNIQIEETLAPPYCIAKEFPFSKAGHCVTRRSLLLLVNT